MGKKRKRQLNIKGGKNYSEEFSKNEDSNDNESSDEEISKDNIHEKKYKGKKDL